MSGHGHSHHGHGPLHGHADHGHGHGAAAQSGDRRRVLLAAILTGGFMVAEAVGGVLTGSLALLADAGHMLTDVIALVLAWLAYRLSERPGNPQMTYGFDRIKILVAYTNGLTVFLIAVWIAVEAVMRLLEPAPVLGGAMLVIAVMGLAVNVVVFLILSGGDSSSLNLRAAILHVLGDLLGSVAAIVAALIILATGWFPADPILSMLVTLLLMRSAWRIMRESGVILLEGAPPHLDRNSIAADVASHAAGVADVHHMHVWSLDGRQFVATLHARLAPGADTEASIAAIKTRLAQAHGIGHATVEVESGSECPDHTHGERMHGTA